MHHGIALLQDLHRLFTDDGFVLSILAVVGAAVVLAFGFGATLAIVAPLLILGIMTAFAERRLRANK
jgi:hypothetical protein